MADHPPVSVLLPTTRWTDACTELAAQLEDHDELQRTVSNDGLLMEYLQVTTVGRTRIVPIGGTIRETVERQVRWTQILRWHFPGAVAGTVLVLLFVLAGAIVAPLPMPVLLTVMHLAVNEVPGVRRWTAVLPTQRCSSSYPSLCTR
ncbi:hypothetical protein [Halalkalicoccus salilacus]|uniref:hypothetical protein n=1 Tax=Halalkalicoccus sp. GCM10025704 TaxID=3252662 RepID=UPI003606D2AE